MKQAAFGWPEMDAMWEEVTKAFAYYGKRIRPLKGSRRDHMSRLIADGYTADELAAAVHGYVRFHEGLEPRKRQDGSEFDPRKWFDPETIFGPEKLEKRIELGEAGPYQSRQNVAAQRATRAEIERQQEIAKVMEERRLRAV